MTAPTPTPKSPASVPTRPSPRSASGSPAVGTRSTATSTSNTANTASRPTCTRSATRSGSRTPAPTMRRGGGPIPYAADAEYAQDTRQNTVMSYFGGWTDSSGNGDVANDGIWSYISD